MSWSWRRRGPNPLWKASAPPVITRCCQEASTMPKTFLSDGQLQAWKCRRQQPLLRSIHRPRGVAFVNQAPRRDKSAKRWTSQLGDSSTPPSSHVSPSQRSAASHFRANDPADKQWWSVSVPLRLQLSQEAPQTGCSKSASGAGTISFLRLRAISFSLGLGALCPRKQLSVRARCARSRLR